MYGFVLNLASCIFALVFFMYLVYNKCINISTRGNPEENEKPQIEIEIEKKEDTADTEEVNTEEVDKEEE